MRGTEAVGLSSGLHGPDGQWQKEHQRLMHKAASLRCLRKEKWVTGRRDVGLPRPQGLWRVRHCEEGAILAEGGEEWVSGQDALALGGWRLPREKQVRAPASRWILLAVKSQSRRTHGWPQAATRMLLTFCLIPIILHVFRRDIRKWSRG